MTRLSKEIKEKIWDSVNKLKETVPKAWLYKDRNWLYQKCMVEKLKDFEMAELAGCAEATIARYRSQFRIFRPKLQDQNGRKRFLIHQPPMLLSKNETIWAMVAGFCDGDGCVSISKAKRWRSSRYTYIVTVVFAQSRGDKIRILHSIQHYYGGFIFGYEQTRLQSRCAQLRIGQRQSEILLRDMLPFMKVRKKQALNALELIELKRNKPAGTWKNEEADNFVQKQEELKLKNHWYNREGTPTSRAHRKHVA